MLYFENCSVYILPDFSSTTHETLYAATISTTHETIKNGIISYLPLYGNLLIGLGIVQVILSDLL